MSSSQDNKKVAVIMPTCNGEDHIQEQIDSILNQTFADYNLFVFDDASTDQTADIVQQMSEKEQRIQLVVNTVRKGVIQNVNDALSEIKADIYFLSDQDDVWMPDKMAKQIDVLQDDKVIMTFTNLTLVDKKGRPQNANLWDSQGINPNHGNVPAIIPVISIVQGCTIAFKERLLQTALPIPEKALMHDHWLSFFAALGGDVVAVRECLVCYRQHGNNTIGAYRNSSERRQHEFAGYMDHRDYRQKKKAIHTDILASLDAFEKRCQKIGQGVGFLSRYKSFYKALLNRQWWRLTILVLMLSVSPAGKRFWRIYLVNVLSPLLYFYQRIMGR